MQLQRYFVPLGFELLSAHVDADLDLRATLAGLLALMLLTDAGIRETILFPFLKPEST